MASVWPLVVCKDRVRILKLLWVLLIMICLDCLHLQSESKGQKKVQDGFISMINQPLHCSLVGSNMSLYQDAAHYRSNIHNNVKLGYR